MFGITHVVAVYSIAQLIGHYHVQGEEYDIVFIFDLILSTRFSKHTLSL